MALISFPPEDLETGLTALLEMADHVSHVQTTMDGPNGLAFVVPDELAERWVDSVKVKRVNFVPAPEDDVPFEEVPEEVPQEDAPAPKRRGRPPGSKNKTAQE